MISNRKKGKICGITMLLIVIVLLCIIAMFPVSVYAEDTHIQYNTTNDTDLEYYIDSDTLINSSLTIRDYAESLYASKAKVGIVNSRYKFQGLDQDDPIVQVVPKHLFAKEGDALEIGDEYGFYINTKEIDNNYLSTVMVFDITTNTDLVETIDRVIIDVKQIFQYKYLYLKPNAKIFNFNNMEIGGANNSEPRVVAWPSRIHDSILEYEIVEEYYMKDISFGASLFNEQELNIGDANYDPYSDIGSYFTGFDYEYNGKYREYGEFPTEDLAMNILDTAEFILSCIPGVGQAVQILGQIYSGVELGAGWISCIDDIDKSINGSIKSINKKLTATCYYQNRDDQLANYKDSYGNPYLVKTAALCINTTEEKSIWYGVGDNVTAYFSVSHSALNGTMPNYTRFTNNLAVKIVDSNNDEIVASKDTVIEDNLREPVKKIMTMEEETQIYMLPNGYTEVVFDAEYASLYEISALLNDTVTLVSDKNKFINTNIRFSQDIREEETLSIKIFNGNKLNKGVVTIGPNSKLENIKIYDDEKYLLKLGSIEGVKRIEASTDLMEICQFLEKINDEMVLYNSFGDVQNCNMLSYPFLEDKSYYLVLTTNAFVENGKINILSPDQINEGDVNSISINKQANYREIKLNDGGQFILTIDGVASVSNCILLDENMNVIDIVLYADNVFRFSANTGKKYYLSISTDIAETVEVIFNRREIAFEWVIQGINGATKYQNPCSTFEQRVEVLIGEKYHFKFLINGIDMDNILYSIDDNNNHFNGYGIHIDSNNNLDVNLNTPIGGTGITLFARYSDYLSYEQHLRVVPVLRDDFNVSLHNEEDLGVMFENLPIRYLKSYTFQLNGVKYTIDHDMYNNCTSDVFLMSILNECKMFDEAKDVKLIMQELQFMQANGIQKNIKIDQEYILNTMFGSGNGSSSAPYTIKAYRHMKNIGLLSTTKDKYFSIEKDLVLSDSKTPNDYICIDEFNGYIEGNNHRIQMPDIRSTNGKKYFGLIGENYGKIYNLTLYGYTINITSESQKVYVGTFVGENYGILQNCNYETGLSINAVFTIKGYFGWITGANYGKVIQSTIKIGYLNGVYGGGMIAGENYGTVSKCTIIKV